MTPGESGALIHEPGKLGFWSRLLKRAGGWFGPYSFADPVLRALLDAKPTSSGVPVDETKSLTSSVVWACVNLIAGTIGSLPLIHYRRLANGGKERFTESRLYRVLHDTPNDEMTSAVFWETLGEHLLLWGNCFAEIRRNARQEIAALWPIEPWRVQWFRNGSQEVRYRIDGKDILTPAEMLHIPGLAPEGIWGYSPIQKARESLGLLLAAERFGGTFFGQGSNFGGILTHPGRMPQAAQDELRASLEKRAQGVDRAHNFIILQEGMKYDKIGIPPNDAQFLETRKFQVGEIARIFGVPPHMVGDVERSTSWGTGIEAQNIGFLTYTLRRYLVRIEREVARKLISPLEMNLQLVEFLVDGLLRGDTQTRYSAYQIGRNGGWFSANDIRRLENMDPLGAQGDVYLVPMNMVPADRLDDIIDKQVAPTPTPPPPPPDTQTPRALDEMREDLQEIMALGRETLAKPVPIPLDTTALVERTIDQIKALPPPPPPPPTDLTPILDKLDAADQERRAVLPPAPTDLSPVLDRLDHVTAALAATPSPLPPDLTPILEKLDAAERERREHAARIAAILPSAHLMIEGVARDFVRREADRAKRAASSPEKLAAWVEDFYPRQGDYAVRAFRGVMQLYLLLTDRPEDTEREIRSKVAPYTTESREALTTVLNAPHEDLKVTVEMLARRWESQRPAALARSLMSEVVNAQP